MCLDFPRKWTERVRKGQFATLRKFLILSTGHVRWMSWRPIMHPNAVSDLKGWAMRLLRGTLNTGV